MKNSVTAAYVNNKLWKVGSVLQAVDICFMSFFTFDAEYQIEAYHIWLFIQRALYDIYLVGTISYKCNYTYQSIENSTLTL